MAKAHLNDEEALRIIQLGLEGNLDTRLEADYFGVSPETIRRIVRRDTYRHLHTQAGNNRNAVRPQIRSEDQADEVNESLKRLMAQLPEEKIGFIE